MLLSDLYLCKWKVYLTFIILQSGLFSVQIEGYTYTLFCNQIFICSNIGVYIHELNKYRGTVIGSFVYKCRSAHPLYTAIMSLSVQILRYTCTLYDNQVFIYANRGKT